MWLFYPGNLRKEYLPVVIIAGFTGFYNTGLEYFLDGFTQFIEVINLLLYGREFKILRLHSTTFQVINLPLFRDAQ